MAIPICHEKQNQLPLLNHLPKRTHCASLFGPSPSPLTVPISQQVTAGVAQRASFQPLSDHVEFTLFHDQQCVSCQNVRAYFDFHGLSYNIVEVNCFTHSQLHSSWAGSSPNLPILVIHNKSSDPQESNKEYIVLHDVGVILSLLESLRLLLKRYNSLTTSASNSAEDALYDLASWSGIKRTLIEFNSYYPPPKTVREANKGNKYQIVCLVPLTSMKEYQKKKLEVQWRKWVDEKFQPAILPFICHTLEASKNTIHTADQRGHWEQTYPAWQRQLLLTFAPWLMLWRSKRWCFSQNEANCTEIIYHLVDEWTMTISKRDEGAFMGGNVPNLADLAFYGCLLSMPEQHGQAELFSKRPKLRAWFLKMQQFKE